MFNLGLTIRDVSVKVKKKGLHERVTVWCICGMWTFLWFDSLPRRLLCFLIRGHQLSPLW